jgi:hypothetical protein
MKPYTTSAICASLLALALGPASQVNAADSDVTVWSFPAGVACDFPLDMYISGGDHRPSKEWTDENGNMVRLISAGKGAAITFVNTDSGTNLSTKANGAVIQNTYNADGSYTARNEGHNILIMYPTDNPPGPSTTLYVGQVVFTVDTAFNFTLVSSSGKTTDICAALMP